MAGTSMISQMMKSGTSASTREFGYRTKYPPITPAIAPLAPIVGIVEVGFMYTCAATAATPHNR